MRMIKLDANRRLVIGYDDGRGVVTCIITDRRPRYIDTSNDLQIAEWMDAMTAVFGTKADQLRDQHYDINEEEK